MYIYLYTKKSRGLVIFTIIVKILKLKYYNAANWRLESSPSKCQDWIWSPSLAPSLKLSLMMSNIPGMWRPIFQWLIAQISSVKSLMNSNYYRLSILLSVEPCTLFLLHHRKYNWKWVLYLPRNRSQIYSILLYIYWMETKNVGSCLLFSIT